MTINEYRYIFEKDYLTYTDLDRRDLAYNESEEEYGDSYVQMLFSLFVNAYDGGKESAKNKKENSQSDEIKTSKLELEEIIAEQANILSYIYSIAVKEHHLIAKTIRKSIKYSYQKVIEGKK